MANVADVSFQDWGGEGPGRLTPIPTPMRLTPLTKTVTPAIQGGKMRLITLGGRKEMMITVTAHKEEVHAEHDLGAFVLPKL